MQKGKSVNTIIVLLIIIIFILGTLVILFATNTISFNLKTSNNNASVENNENSTIIDSNLENSESQQNNEEIYASIITEYKNAINDTEIESNYDIISQKYSNLNEQIISYYHMYKTQKFNYTFYNIDNFGNDELIIVENSSDNYTIIDIFTYDGLSPKKQITDSCLGDRCSVEIWNNGVFYYHGSGGASSGVLEFSKIASDGYTNEKIKTYYYEYDNANNISFYSDVAQTNKLNYTSISQVEAIHLDNASVISMNSLTWNSIN